jgi:hypothetical protein
MSARLGAFILGPCKLTEENANLPLTAFLRVLLATLDKRTIQLSTAYILEQKTVSVNVMKDIRYTFLKTDERK